MNAPTTSNDSRLPPSPAASRSDTPAAAAAAQDDAGAAVRRPGEGGSIEGLAFVMDVPVEVTVEVGRRKMKIGEVLRLGPGSVLELDSAAGDPLNIYVNNRLIARGEAVVVGDRYGVRLVEVLAGEHRGRLGASR